MVVFLEVKEGGQDRDEEAVKVYLIRFIADLPLRLVYGLHTFKPKQLNIGIIIYKVILI